MLQISGLRDSIKENEKLLFPIVITCLIFGILATVRYKEADYFCYAYLTIFGVFFNFLILILLYDTYNKKQKKIVYNKAKKITIFSIKRHLNNLFYNFASDISRNYNEYLNDEARNTLEDIQSIFSNAKPQIYNIEFALQKLIVFLDNNGAKLFFEIDLEKSTYSCFFRNFIIKEENKFKRIIYYLIPELIKVSDEKMVNDALSEFYDSFDILNTSCLDGKNCEVTEPYYILFKNLAEKAINVYEALEDKIYE